MRAAVSVLVSVLASCGPGIRDANKLSLRSPRFHEIEENLVKASSAGDVAAVRKLMRGNVVTGGLWFDDLECMKRFSTAGTVGEDQLDAFAACVTGMKLRLSGRADRLSDVGVFTYGPGIEIEVRLLDTDDGPRLQWMGYVSRRDMQDALPTISAATLESLRAAGDRHGPVDDAGKLASDVSLVDSAYAWMKVCIDVTGAVTGTHVREASSPAAARAFSQAASAWRFRPFVTHGQASPVCSMVRSVYPAEKATTKEIIPFPLPPGPEEMINVPSKALGERIAGEPYHGPSLAMREQMRHEGIPYVILAVQYCLGTDGRVVRAQVLRPSGLARLDTEVVDSFEGWRFRPYLDEGKAVPVCSTTYFVHQEQGANIIH